jgi:exodeoxyribonuclease V gamma subunit
VPIVVHRRDRPEALADGLAAMLRENPGDVFDPEWVVVPAQGVQRWLIQRLSHVLGAGGGDDGVCAGLDLRTPASLVSMLLGRDRDDPWIADRLVWPTLAAVDECMGAHGFDALTRHLGGGPRAGDPQLEWLRQARQTRRYAVARRLAGLFSAYARQRPSMLADWEDGGAGDGCGGTIDPDLAWQPELWRRVLAQAARRTGATESPSARHARVVNELRNGSVQFPVPGRISLFGHTQLPASEIELLAALGVSREVHLWLPHPSPALWESVAEHIADAHTLPGRRARANDDSATYAQHPLLATLGRDIRELEQGLLAAGTTVADVLLSPNSADNPSTRLALLQADIRANRAPDPARPLAAGDLSVQVHSCHGLSHQVEVLREVLTQLFQDDPTLEPRDVLVLCPDVEQFAPLVRAAFGSTLSAPAGTARHPGHGLRVQLADRELAATNPLVELAQIVVGLVAGRVTASEVLGLAAHEAVARRFGFDEDDLATLGHWVAESGARWGLDAAHRGEYGLRDLADNTWANALDRLALGVAVAADSDADAAANAPVDDIGSNDIGRVGRFLELLDLVRAAAEHVRQPSLQEGTLGRLSAGEWTDWLRETVTSLGEVAREDRWQRAQFLSELATIAAGGEGLPLRINDIVVLLGQRWGARPTRANFRTGAMTVCTMVPMRTIPHRVVAILGLDDGAFPRSPVVDGDDVLARRALVGQRDPRSEDRQLLLDALMSASDHFVALYAGHDEHTGARRPPAVPLQELISAANRTGQAPATSADANGVVRAHPLQAFDARNFGPQPPIPGGSFDRAALEGAVALGAHRRSGDTTRPLMVSEPLPVQPVSALTLDELTRFYENPAREFCRQRLGIAVPREDDEPTDHIPIGLDGLETWQIGDRVLRAVLDGGDPTTALEREQLAGTLPPVALGGRLRQEIAGTVAAIARGVDTGARRSVEVRIDLPSGLRVTGVVSGVEDHRLTLTTYSTISAKHEIVAWVRLLALAVAEPQIHWVAELTGKRGKTQLTAPLAEQATTLLEGLVDVRTRGMRYPLGLPPKTARAFAVQAVRGDSPAIQQSAFRAANSEWAGRFPERDDRWWAVVLGPEAPLERLNHLGTLSFWAPRVWGPLLQARGRS